MPPGSGAAVGRMMAMQIAQHKIVAFMQVHKIKDLGYPSDPTKNHVLVKVIIDEHGKHREVQRLGPFLAKNDEKDKKVGELVEADCTDEARLLVKAPLHFGGMAKEGAIFVRFIAYFVDKFGTEPDPIADHIGDTDPIMVSFMEKSEAYVELRNKRSEGAAVQVMGGITVSHRLSAEGELAMMGLDGRNPKVPVKKAELAEGLVAEIMTVVDARTGTFPKYSPEEAFEFATTCGEAQNRALKQRVKMADMHAGDDSGKERMTGHYREWADLDSLFSTMGPNPLASTEVVGPGVCRGMKEEHSIAAEIGHRGGDVNLLQQIYNGDPFKVTTHLRPVICKDPDEIALTKDMSWLPDPPNYAPISDLHNEDRLTMRLAGFEPGQCAALGFHDVTPNYTLDQDIWGAQVEIINGKCAFEPECPKGRVKDECLMA